MQDHIPEEYKPLSPWGYFWLQILFAIPVIGFICLLFFAIAGSNVNSRNFARSYFCVLIIVVIAVLILLTSGSALLAEILAVLQQSSNPSQHRAKNTAFLSKKRKNAYTRLTKTRKNCIIIDEI